MENNSNTDSVTPHSNGDAAGHGNSSSPDGVQSVKVAVNIRPLIGHELVQGCKDCVSVVPGEPQVQLGNHSFTFDHVYGSTGAPSSCIFNDCVHPLVDGLFHGYNATVLAYGQTGSGKTYTMGTGYTVGGSTEGVIPKVMQMIFDRVAELKSKADFHIRVSFIEILKEEVHDLLDPNPPIALKSEPGNGAGSKAGPVGKPPIQIRENTNGEITLAGVTEVDVRSQMEMGNCLEQGSLCRATASTNMNSRSSRSHAIFTITVEQKRISEPNSTDGGDDFLCAKLHLVDLAGSERAKRTGADGVRFKEGVHINKGLLALGNVISALGDDKKRKEGGHVPYRDSKLTRLLQDSLGGNSRTVMIACISPADSNAEETLNTLKYANRARNIQNKPVVNRDPMAAEMQKMRQQVELLQAELLCIREGGSFEEIQVLKQRISWLETSLLELKQELQVTRDNLHLEMQQHLETQVERDKLKLCLQSGKSWEEIKSEEDSQPTSVLEAYAERIKSLENEVHQLRSAAPAALVYTQVKPKCNESVIDPDVPGLDIPEGDDASEIEEETVTKEIEHARLQDTLDKELEELNKRLEQKEAEMKTFVKSDGTVLKQHFEKKILELEEEKKHLQSERDNLLAELTRFTNTSDEQSKKLQEQYMQKVKALETQISELKKKQDSQAQLLKQKQRSDEAAKRLQDDIQRIKSQKVQLQNKIKTESEQFRSWKQMREKEVLQLKKEGRRNAYEMHKLQALIQRQKQVMQRKTEEAAVSMRRLKEVLEARKAKENIVPVSNNANGPNGKQVNEKSLHQWFDHELEVAVHIHEVRSNYEKQTETRAALAKELAKLKNEHDMQSKQPENLSRSVLAMSPGARQAKIKLLESMLNASSSTLVAMASQLSEVEERERAYSGRARWQNVRSMGEAKCLLQYIYNSAVNSRCKLREKDLQINDLKEKVSELTDLLRQNEVHKKELDRKQFVKEQYISKMLASAVKSGSTTAMKNCYEEICKSLIQVGDPSPRQLEFPDEPEQIEATNSEQPNDPAKESSSTVSSEQDESSTSEEMDESDMDIDDDELDEEDDFDEYDDASDEDWSIGGQKRQSRPKLQKSKSDKLRRPFDTLNSVVDGLGESDGKPRSESPVCCSCSKYSGCKTNKCACKVAGSFCGLNCSCSSKKCENKENGNREQNSEESDTSEIAEAMETLKLDKDIKHMQKSQANECDPGVASDVLNKTDVQRAEQVLAKHGASILGQVWTDGHQQILTSAAKRSLPQDSETPSEKGNVRIPLSDIGNNTQTEDSDGQPKMKQRKRWGKTLIQIVPSPAGQTPNESVASRQMSSSLQNDIQSLPENIEPRVAGSATHPRIPLPPIPHGHAGDSSSSRGALHHQLVGENDGALPPFVVGSHHQRSNDSHPHMQSKLHRNGAKKKAASTPPASPLKARNTGHSSSSTSASPRAPGKSVVREKENA
uniref:Kinesin 4-Ic protein n=1 Tax=Marsilea vestita TaxID=59764 RepID=A0A142KW92_MARVE|nr:kinesin 4-Ic protein [Marsilea vestita]